MAQLPTSPETQVLPPDSPEWVGQCREGVIVPALNVFAGATAAKRHVQPNSDDLVLLAVITESACSEAYIIGQDSRTETSLVIDRPINYLARQSGQSPFVFDDSGAVQRALGAERRGERPKENDATSLATHLMESFAATAGFMWGRHGQITLPTDLHAVTQSADGTSTVILSILDTAVRNAGAEITKLASTYEPYKPPLLRRLHAAVSNKGKRAIAAESLRAKAKLQRDIAASLSANIR